MKESNDVNIIPQAQRGDGSAMIPAKIDIGRKNVGGVLRGMRGTLQQEEQTNIHAQSSRQASTIDFRSPRRYSEK